MGANKKKILINNRLFGSLIIFTRPYLIRGEMKKILCALIVLLMAISTLVFAETRKRINERNEYGGVTEMVTYSPGDKEYQKDGMSKNIIYFGSNKKVVKNEGFFTDEFVRKDGITKTINYFDSNEKIMKKEFIMTDEFVRKYGMARGMLYYDSNRNVVKKEYYGKDGALLKE